MRWSAAEQLLERECEPDRYRVVSSMASFADDEERCRCESCRPDLIKRIPPAAGTPAPVSDLDDALTTLRPTLIRAARLQLQNRGLDEQLAEDLVQEAIARWIARRLEYRGPGRLHAWLRKSIGWLAAEGLRRRDLLDVRPLSLDEPWART
jgi:hypothetical protein